MLIDLNDFTKQDVADLLASKDDSRHRQLRVTKDGKAYLSDVVGNQDTDDLAFRLETWQAHNGYTGPTAAADDKFVARIEKVLRDNWPTPTDTYIDLF
ncbi:hypothetical protein [Paracoccus hibiscisoli]|uniref:Uncharacterized protein n=1 Tax=Paracoccus hibiscisoli TaxID=2023261 RepID=A0A4U0R1B7_9RHOB|nr:hypothetical protein [Paracoccus hibiscisoli]TJZ82024.1 hypothetical protein FA740_15815 [Paracoccus hibiscisoli]